MGRIRPSQPFSGDIKAGSGVYIRHPGCWETPFVFSDLVHPNRPAIDYIGIVEIVTHGKIEVQFIKPASPKSRAELCQAELIGGKVVACIHVPGQEVVNLSFFFAILNLCLEKISNRNVYASLFATWRSTDLSSAERIEGVDVTRIVFQVLYVTKSIISVVRAVRKTHRWGDSVADSFQ